MKIRVLSVLTTLAISAAVIPARAHHGTLVSYDLQQQWTAQATVVEFRYVNPHVQLYFDVKNKDGQVTHYNGEMLPNPAQLIANGWSRKRSAEVLQAGTLVTVTAAPARVGGNVVLVTKILNDKGQEILGTGLPITGTPAPGAAR
ncbi:MAG TPA: DUF6152 family protein [Vicinamibacterales bacterium]|nr:DUF6152 family protein [Vicinamibacterales bacterium]